MAAKIWLQDAKGMTRVAIVEDSSFYTKNAFICVSVINNLFPHSQKVRSPVRNGPSVLSSPKITLHFPSDAIVMADWQRRRTHFENVIVKKSSSHSE